MGATGNNLCKAFLPTAAGLQWSVSLMTTGLVAGFPHIGPQLDYQVQFMLFFGYVSFFLLLLPRLRRDPSFFFSKAHLYLAMLMSVAGCLLLLFPVVLVSFPIVQSVVAPILYSYSNMFGLFFLIAAFAKTDGRARLGAITGSSLVACVIIVLPALIEESWFSVFFLLALMAKWAFALLASNEAEKSRAVPQSLSAPQPSILYVAYGACIGCIPGFDAIRSAVLSSDALLVAGAAAAAFGAVLLVASKKLRGLRIASVAVVVFGAFTVLVFELSAYTSIHAVFVLTYLLYWSYLLFGIAPRGEASSVDPLALVTGGFALGWVAARLVALNAVGDYPEVIGGLSIAASVVTFVVPLYSVTHCYSEKVTFGEQTAGDPLRSIEEKCLVVAEAYGLTNREKEVVILLAAGYNRKYICEKLVISEGTARTHIKHIYRKLDIHSKEELLELIHAQNP